MRNKLSIILMAAIALAIIPSASAPAFDNIPPELKRARFVFDSDRDWARDKMRSVYLWEDGRTQKLFKGAICPRWSLDGEQIACILTNPEEARGKIAILDRAGNLKKEITPREYAQRVEWLDENNLIYIARGRVIENRRKTYLIRYDLSSDKEKTLYTTQDSGKIYQMNWNRDRDELTLDIKDRFPGEQEFERRTAILKVRADKPPEIVYQGSAFKPALFHDDETLIFQTALDSKGNPVQVAGTGVLAVYNFQTRQWASVRDTFFTRNTRFSRDGEYFYSAEGEGERAVVIRLFSVADLDQPLVRVSPRKGEPAWPSRDLRPDLFIPAGPLVAALWLAPAPEKTVVAKTPPPSAKPSRPHPPARLRWRPDPNRPRLERPLPERKPPGPSLSAPTSTPPPTLTSTPPPTSTATPAPRPRPPVPPGATPTARGWVYTTPLGDRYSVEYSEDGTSYTVTEEGSQGRKQTTYQLYGAKQNPNQSYEL